MPAGLKFLAEVIWWVITAAWLLLRRAPKWIRIVLIVWACIWFFSYCARSRSSPPAGKIPAEKSEKRAKSQLTAADLAAAQKALKESGLPAGLAEFGNEVAKRLATEIKNSEAADKQIVAVPFHAGVADEKDATFLRQVFTPLWGRLSIERAGETGLIATPLPSPSNEALAALGKKLDAGFVLGARIVEVPVSANAPSPTERKLEVVLMNVATGVGNWSGLYPLTEEPNVIANSIAEGVLTTAKPQ